MACFMIIIILVIIFLAFVPHGQHLVNAARVSTVAPYFYCVWPTRNWGLPPTVGGETPEAPANNCGSPTNLSGSVRGG